MKPDLDRAARSLDNLLALGAIPTEPAPGEPLLDLTSYMEGYDD